MKCHSKRLDSRGEAWRVGSGLERNSWASLSIRLMVGDLVLKVGRDIFWIGVVVKEGQMRRIENVLYSQ